MEPYGRIQQNVLVPDNMGRLQQQTDKLTAHNVKSRHQLRFHYP